MATTRRAIALLALVLSAVLGASAFTSGALAYPPGTKAKVTTDKNRVDPGQQITINGQNYRTNARVSITVTCRAGNPAKKYVMTYRARAVNGSFSKTITINNMYPNGRCQVNATTGRSPENSDNTKFFVNTPSRRGSNSDAAVKLSSASGTIQTPGSGAGWGAVLVGGLALMFLVGGSTLLITGRRKNAVVPS